MDVTSDVTWDVLCDVVLPCRDEAPALPGVLSRMPAGFRAIVVDNGSRDGTADVARSYGATVVHEPRPGYGSAVHAGVLAATAQYVAVMDGDGSIDAGALPTLLAEVTAGRADLAVGRRVAIARGAMPWHARLGNAFVSRRLRRATGLDLHDLASVRVSAREPLLALDVQDRRFGYPLELLCRASAAGWHVSEHDVAYAPRAAGTRSKVSGTVGGTLRTAQDFRRVLRQAAAT